MPLQITGLSGAEQTQEASGAIRTPGYLEVRTGHKHMVDPENTSLMSALVVSLSYPRIGSDQLRDNQYLLFECKNQVDKNRQEINKDETGQMNNSCGRPISVHNMRRAEKRAKLEGTMVSDYPSPQGDFNYHSGKTDGDTKK